MILLFHRSPYTLTILDVVLNTKGKVRYKRLHTSQVAHQAGVNPGSYSTKRLEICYSPLDVMLVHHTVTPSMEFTGSHLYTCDRRGGLIVSALTSGSWDKLWFDGPLGSHEDLTYLSLKTDSRQD